MNNNTHHHADYYKKRILPLLLLAAFALVIYWPYITQGGFIVDDWDLVLWAKIHKASFFHSFNSWPAQWLRPLAVIVLTISSLLFGGNPTGYIITNILFWICAIGITARVLFKHTKGSGGYVFAFLALVPVISSTAIFSPAGQLNNPVSIFLWSVSLWCTDKYMRTGKTGLLISSYVLMLCSLLTYEITLPLLAINILYPITCADQDQSGKAGTFKKLLKYALPVILALLTIFLLQKVILPKFVDISSRFNFNLGAIYYYAIAWPKAILIDFPLLLASGVYQSGFAALKRFDLWALIVILLIFFSTAEKSNKGTNTGKKLFFISLLALLSCSLLYILTSNVPIVSGYPNRGLHSTWLALSLVIALSDQVLPARTFRAISCSILILCTLSFLLERNNYIESYRLQSHIAQDCVNKVRQSIRGTAKHEIIVIGNVPQYLLNNFNNEDVFANSWDFGSALYLKSDGLISGGDVLTKDPIEKKRTIIDGGILRIEKLGSDANKTPTSVWSSPISSLWYYQYDQMTQESQLLKIKDPQHLQTILNYISQHDNHSCPSLLLLGRINWKNTPIYKYFSQFKNEPV